MRISDWSSDVCSSDLLVADLLVLDALQLAGRLLQRALDGVLGHVDRQALVDRRAQARVVGRLGAALAGRAGDFADDLGEDLAATGVGGGLASFVGGDEIGRASWRGRVGQYV